MSLKHPKFVFDICQTGIRFEYDECHAAREVLLGAPDATSRWLGAQAHAEISGCTKELLPLIERAAPNLSSIRDCDVVIGRTADPLAEGIMAFSALHELLESIVMRTPRSVTLKTRSPLVLVLAPFLRHHGISVTIAFECVDDRSSQTFFPGSPRVTDRLQAMFGLRRAGCLVRPQLAPLLSAVTPIRLLHLRRFAQALNKSGQPVLLTDLLPSRSPLALPSHEAVRIFENLFQENGIAFDLVTVKEGPESMREAA